MCDQTLNVLQPVKAGMIKGFAATTRERLSVAPELPTAAEAGLPGFEITVWFGMYAPKNTPKPVIDKLSAALQEALKDPDVKARLASAGAETVAPERGDAGGAARPPQVGNRPMGADHPQGRRHGRLA